MDKTPSNSNIDRMAYAIRSKAPRDITLQDFDSHDSADGISLLLTMVVNQIYSLKDLVLSPSQLARLAAHAAVIHPTLLLEYLLDDNTALEFCTRALATRPLFLEADLVCPMDTPYLLTDVTLQEQLGQLDSAPPSELRRIFPPFLQCFYPATWETMEQILRQASDNLLQRLISGPGEIHRYCTEMKTHVHFSPPRWISLSHLDTEPGVDGDDASSEEEPGQLIRPLSLMNVSQRDFDHLTAEQQRNQVLTFLPASLGSMVSPAVLGYVMVHLTEMASQSIHGAMDPSIFTQLVNQAKTKTSTHTGSTSIPPRTYYYRFRLQHKGRGCKSWKSMTPGAILDLWLRAWVPLCHTSGYTFTLVRHHAEKQLRAIALATIADLPPRDDLEQYVYDVIFTRRGSLQQFDFWFISECEDIRNGGAPSFLRSSELTRIYNSNIRDNAIWSMKMERITRGFVPCILFVNSLLHDPVDMIKEEVLRRVPSQWGITADSFEVEWTTIQTNSQHTHSMMHCIMTAPADHAKLCRIWECFVGDVADAYPVSGLYEPVVIPHPRPASFDQELNQAIVRHLTFLHSITFVTISGLPPLNIYSLVPEHPVMPEVPAGSWTVRQLLLHGAVITPDGHRLSSPITRVATDLESTRLYLYAARKDAQALLLFSKAIHTILPIWVGQEITTDLHLDDVERLVGRTPPLGDNPAGEATTTSQSPASTVESPPMLEETDSTMTHSTQITRQEWVSAMAYIKRVDDKVSQVLTLDSKISKILSLLECSSHITSTIGPEDVVSSLTQCITDSSQSLTSHATEISTTATDTLSKQLEAYGEKMVQICHTVTDHISQPQDGPTLPVLAQTQNVTQQSVVDETRQPPKEPAPDTRLHATQTAPALVLCTRQASSPTPQNWEDRAHEESAAADDDPKAATLPITLPTEITTATPGLSPAQESPGTPINRMATCYGCNKLDADIHACDHCELPYHYGCLVLAPTDGDNRYCPGCMKTLFTRPHHSPIAQTQESSTDVGSGLSEADSASASDSESEYVAESPARKSPELTGTGMSQPERTTYSKQRLRPK